MCWQQWWWWYANLEKGRHNDVNLLSKKRSCNQKKQKWYLQPWKRKLQQEELRKINVFCWLTISVPFSRFFTCCCRWRIPTCSKSLTQSYTNPKLGVHILFDSCIFNYLLILLHHLSIQTRFLSCYGLPVKTVSSEH